MEVSPTGWPAKGTQSKVKDLHSSLSEENVWLSEGILGAIHVGEKWSFCSNTQEPKPVHKKTTEEAGTVLGDHLLAALEIGGVTASKMGGQEARVASSFDRPISPLPPGLE